MGKKRTYSTTCVERLDVETLMPALGGGCVVSLDVAKSKFVGAIAAGDSVQTLFHFRHPTQTRRFLDVVDELHRGLEGKVRVAMEPTGTYGDAIRHQLVKRGVSVWMLAPKKTHDSQSLFDGVASMHDPKSAVHIARLCAMGLAHEWRPPPVTVTQLRALVELRAHEQGREEHCFGRLEAALARYWPELGEHFDVRGQKTALSLLCEFASPARVNARPQETAKHLHTKSRGRLKSTSIDALLAATADSLGMPTTPEAEAMIAALASEAIDARSAIGRIDAAIAELAGADEVFRRLQDFMGTFSAAVLVSMCNPADYAAARQLEKACGLNLREKSSGEVRREHVRVRITKRGPSLVRKVLYLFALRMISQYPEVCAWYQRRRKYAAGQKQAAVAAVMRKLVRAAFHVARGGSFDPKKLFDTRRLRDDICALQASTQPRRRMQAATPHGVTT
jgi:transposase